MGNVNMPITAIVQKGMPKPSGKSDSPKVSPAGWPMKKSPIKHVNKFMDENHQHNKNHNERPLHSHKNYEQKKKKKASSANTQSPMKKISGACKAAAKKKFDVWPSAYASGWGVRCTRAGGPGKMGKSKK